MDVIKLFVNKRNGCDKTTVVLPTRVLLLATCLPGFESPQALRRTNSKFQMQCSPSFDCNLGKQNDPTACWHQHSIPLTYK